MGINRNEFPIIEVSGSSYEMGYQYGAQAAHLIESYLIWIERITKKSRDVLCSNAIKFLPLIQKLSPEMVEELKGLSSGAGISMEEAVLCQARAEAGKVPEGACTAFALTGKATADGNTISGQNQDVEPEFADVGILLRVRPKDGRPRAIMFTWAGQLGYVGLNEYGVSHWVNSVYNFTWRMALPMYPIRRVMEEKRTVAECVDVLKRFRVCSAFNMVLADGRKGIADVEVRPEGVAIFKDDNPDWLVHTNHYISKEFEQFEDGFLPDSPIRLARMRQLIKEQWGSITTDTMKSFFKDHTADPGGICRHGPNGWHSICGYIAEPSKHLFHVRRGHGCTGTWTTYEV